MIECILKCLLVRFLTTFYSVVFFFFSGCIWVSTIPLASLIRLFAKTDNPRIANKQNRYKKEVYPFICKRWHLQMPYFTGFRNGYLAHGPLTILKWVKRGFYCCFDIWGIYVMTSFLPRLVGSCELVCHTFPGLYLCWIFALSWGKKKQNTNTWNHTSPHCNEDQSETMKNGKTSQVCL